MKTNDILNEKPSVADLKKQQARSMTQKADDFMRKSFLQKSIDTLQGATGRRGVAPTELEPKYKIVKKKKEKPAVKGEPQAQAPAQAPKQSSGFPVSKTGVELKPGDNITYQNAKGQMKDGVVTVMLKTRDKQGDLQIQLNDPIELYTYGSPRVGWKKYCNSLGVIHHRWRNNNDIVTKVPLWIMGYRHDGELHYITSDNKIGKPSFIDWCKGMWTGIKNKRFDSIADHDIQAYYDNIDKAL